MKKIFAALMIAAAIAAFVLPKAQTYATESADDYVAVQMESDCENFTFSGFSVIPNDNASKYAHIGSYEKGSVFSGGFTGGKITFYGWKGGEGGRITLADVKDAVAELPKPMSTMRKVIARRLSESKHVMPHFYVTVSIDMSAVKAKRAALKKQNISISVNVFIAKAVALALKEFPNINAECIGDAVVHKTKVNLGIAVSLDNGLVVPVIRNADRKALDELADEIAEQAGKARSGKLTPEDMSGGSFTISNMGMMNVENFCAIINPGESGILAVSSAIPTPVVDKEGNIVVRDMMKITLSVDHRIVDGSEGAKFVNAVKAKLEDAALWDSLI